MSAPASPPYLVDTDGESVVALRRHDRADAPRALEQCVDPLSIAWTTVPVPYTIDDAVQFLTEAMPGGWERGTEWAFAIDVDGRYGGTVSLRPEDDGIAEIAYGSHPDVRGTGAVERALRLLLEWGFAEQGLRTVVWRANRGNWASRRLAWRLGFSFDGTVRQALLQRGEYHDAWVGTLLAGEDRAPRDRWLEVPRIDSPRLPIRLRPFHEGDLARAVEACQDAETRHWLGGIPADPTPSAIAEDLLRAGERAAVASGLVAAVASTEDDGLLGRISVFDLGRLRLDGEIGYWVHPDARGHGVATEMIRLWVRHLLISVQDGGLGLQRVRAHAALANAGSRRALEVAGFSEVGIERLGTSKGGDRLVDAVVYELLA